MARLYDIHSVISPDGSLHTVTPTNGQPLLLEFEATAGQRYSTVVDVTTGSLGCVSWLELRTAQWAQLPRVQEAYGCTFIMQQSEAASSSTVHFVALDPSNTNTGTANVNLYTLVDYAGAITPDGPAVVAPLLTPGQRTMLTFTGTAGQRISARSFATSGSMGCPGRLELQRPDETIFPEDAGTCSALAFHEPVYLPTTGTYTVIVDPRYDHTPTVSVTAYLVADDVVGPLTINGSPLPVTLTTVGQKARLTFTASEGQQVTVRLTNNTMGQTTVRLLRPNGNNQTSRTSSSASFNLTTQTLSTPGTYTVEVDPNDTNFGGISVQVTSP